MRESVIVAGAEAKTRSHELCAKGGDSGQFSEYASLLGESDKSKRIQKKDFGHFPFTMSAFTDLFHARAVPSSTEDSHPGIHTCEL